MPRPCGDCPPVADTRIPVVIAAPPMRTGGTEQHLVHVLPELAKRGFDITAVLLGSGGALEEKLRATDVKVVTPSSEYHRPLRTLAQAATIRSAVLRTDARIVHAFLSEPYLAATAAQIMLVGRKPALVHARRSLAFYTSRHPMAQMLERYAHRYAARLVANSSAVAKELIEESGTPAKVEVIHNGIPLPGGISPEERAEARRLFGLTEREFVLTLVANFYPYKGHADLISALALAAPRMPQPWRLVLAGRDAGTRDRLQEQINGLNLTSHVNFIGEWPGSRQPYAAADIGLLVSHTEGFSNSLIEGMAGGLPMIATAVGGNLDALVHGNTGLLVPAELPETLADAILKLADNPPLRRTLGDNARTSAERQFSLEACVSAYERLWRGLAA
jgi:glycosyltransferase involved in cell wall biosynthesis